MEELKPLLNAILDRLDTQGANIEQIKMDIAKMKGDIGQLKEDVSSLKQGQKRQERILEKLSLRSIEQETDIQELKRIK